MTPGFGSLEVQFEQTLQLLFVLRVLLANDAVQSLLQTKKNSQLRELKNEKPNSRHIPQSGA